MYGTHKPGDNLLGIYSATYHLVLQVAKCDLTSDDASGQLRGESAAQTVDDPLPDHDLSNSAESADMVPPSKKAKLETADCEGSASPPLRDSAAASSATEHAQSDVAMDTDEPIEGQEQPSNVCTCNYVISTCTQMFG